MVRSRDALNSPGGAHAVPPRPLRSDARRNRLRITSAARDLFAARGLAPSLNEVARHAGVGVGTVYRRFATKADLFEAIFADPLGELSARAAVALRRDDPWIGLSEFVDGLCAAAAADRGLREIMFGHSYGGPGVAAARNELAALVTGLVDCAQAAGGVRGDLSHGDLPIFALLAGTVNSFAGHQNPQLWRRYVALLLDGMRGDVDPPTVRALDRDELQKVMRSWELAETAE